MGGLRHLFRTLGFEVFILRPESLVPPSHGEKLFAPGRCWVELQNLNPDLVIVEQWALLDDLPHLEIPVICDLHGSLYWENWYKSYRDPGQLLAKVHCLQKADYFFVPGLRQFYYFLGWGMMAGLPCDEDRILKIPLVLDPAWYAGDVANTRAELVSGGGKWPWVYTEVSAELESYFHDQGLTIESYYYEPGVSKGGETGAGAHAVGNEGLGHEKIVEAYRGCAGALDLYWMNRERSLAITTRSVEYLYCGLPLVYSAGLELADDIVSKSLGIVVQDWRELIKLDSLKAKLDHCRKEVVRWRSEGGFEEEAIVSLRKWMVEISKRRKSNFSLSSLETENRDLKKELTTAKTSLLLVEHQNEYLKEERAYYRDLWVRDTRDGYHKMIEVLGKQSGLKKD